MNRSAHWISNCVSRCAGTEKTATVSRYHFYLRYPRQGEALSMSDRVAVFNNGRIGRSIPRAISICARARRLLPDRRDIQRF